jgi:hypothetical protein
VVHKNQTDKERMKPREVVTLTLSILAFCLSILTGYLNFFHQEDRLSVIFQPKSLARLTDDTTLQIVPEGEDIIFVNSGTRPAVILWMQMMYVQLQEGESCTTYTWGRWPLLSTDLGPLIVKAKDIVTQKVRITGAPPWQTEMGITLATNNGFSFKVSEANKGNKHIDMDICIEVHFGTPDLDHGSRTVSTFRHTVTEGGVLYGGSDEPRDPNDYKPRVLIRQLGTIFN